MKSGNTISAQPSTTDMASLTGCGDLNRIADGDVEMQCIASLQGRGFYIILSGNRTVKVAY